MRNRIPRVQVGDPITADLFNQVIDRIMPFSKISVASCGYLGMMSGPHGTCLWLNLPSDQMARLSGSSNPYSWQSVYWDGNAWVDGPNVSYNGNDAYELNGATGLNGKVVRMRWTSAGDWRFQALRHSCAWTFSVKGCNNTAVLGCVVSVKQGGVEIATCTGSGCILNVPLGTYDVTVTPPAGSGYGTYAATLAHTCSQTTNVNLTADSDSLCVSSCGPCQILPKSIAITFNNDPLPCAQWQDVTAVLDPTYPIQPTWVSTTPVLVNSFGDEFMLIFQCSPFQRYEIGAIHPGSPTNFIGFRDFLPPDGISCTPFSFTGGLIGFPGGPYCGTWSALGA